MSTLEAWVGGVLGGVLVVGYLALVAVDAFRRARAAFDAAMAEIDAACSDYRVETPAVSGGAR